eukprot:TRINITY_DN3529_c0_g1_i2.p1 TRINITY_DN3529_c0_g1~~TRINITY_DN3529_c0_g1_i2.p1  ORF type:complete len:549 (+),score=103.50 TRINITY_DN3529_c0_g1_i2:110-1756(+)
MQHVRCGTFEVPDISSDDMDEAESSSDEEIVLPTRLILDELSESGDENGNESDSTIEFPYCSSSPPPSPPTTASDQVVTDSTSPPSVQQQVVETEHRAHKRKATSMLDGLDVTLLEPTEPRKTRLRAQQGKLPCPTAATSIAATTADTASPSAKGEKQTKQKSLQPSPQFQDFAKRVRAIAKTPNTAQRQELSQHLHRALTHCDWGYLVAVLESMRKCRAVLTCEMAIQLLVSPVADPSCISDVVMRQILSTASLIFDKLLLSTRRDCIEQVALMLQPHTASITYFATQALRERLESEFVVQAVTELLRHLSGWIDAECDSTAKLRAFIVAMCEQNTVPLLVAALRRWPTRQYIVEQIAGVIWNLSWHMGESHNLLARQAIMEVMPDMLNDWAAQSLCGAVFALNDEDRYPVSDQLLDLKRRTIPLMLQALGRRKCTDNTRHACFCFFINCAKNRLVEPLLEGNVPRLMMDLIRRTGPNNNRISACAMEVVLHLVRQARGAELQQFRFLLKTVQLELNCCAADELFVQTAQQTLSLLNRAFEETGGCS